MKNSNVQLEPITARNWKSCAGLQLAPGQEKFLPDNLYSIAEAQFYPQARSRAIYNGDHVLVGYALYGRDIFSNKWKIFRLMIDAAHQQKGYGTSAMKEVIRQISVEPDGNETLICYQDNNHAARKLYATLGFMEQNVDVSGKVTALLIIQRTV